MASEISEIARFLRASAPFDALDDDDLSAITRQVEVTYRKAGEVILEAGTLNDRLYVVRSGAVELMLAGKELTARLAQGSCFAYPSLLRGGEVRNTTTALEDTLLYAVSAEVFHALREKSAAFREFFAEDEAKRLKHALASRRADSGFDLAKKQVFELIGSRTPVSCSSSVSIRDAVRLMDAEGVSTLAICDDGQLTGIFTDKDLRSRVVAADTALDRPIADVMTPNPRTLTMYGTAAEAMAMMASGGFRHIPLVDLDGSLTGILSATDILAAIGHSAIDAGMLIAKAKTVDELIAASRSVPDSYAKMVASGMGAAHVMHFTSALGEAIHRRVAQLAEEELGPPPCLYAFVAFGSLAREEQLTGSDQDNGFVIADEADEAAFAYFEKLGTRISDVLNECGYAYCKGGIMAKQADQRRTLSGWRERYEHWIQRPDEDRILRATIFFDMRHMHGDNALSSQLREHTLGLFKDSPLFVSYLARDALRSKIPLGFFRNLVLDKTEDGQKVFNAKKQAIMPIVDIARTQALAAGLPEVGTIGRLRALAKAGKMNREDAQSLEDALLLVNELRIEHQAAQIARGETPDNLIAPEKLSPLERDYLKDAFAVIREALDALRRNFAGGIA